MAEVSGKRGISMSDNPSNPMKSFKPAPPRRAPLTVDIAEFSALRVIVMGLAAIMAKEHEQAGGGPAGSVQG